MSKRKLFDLEDEDDVSEVEKLLCEEELSLSELENEEDSDDDFGELLGSEYQNEAGNVGDDDGNDFEADEDDDNEEEESSWSQWNIGDVQPSFKKFLFCSDNVGFNEPDDLDIITPLDFLSLFLDDEILGNIVVHTNLYAQQRKQKNTPLTKNSMWGRWRDVTLEEFKAFLGVIINMALNNKPNLSDYFSNSWLDKQPFFKDIFSRERFYMIYWNLQIAFESAENISKGISSKSRKARLFLKRLETNFQKYYTPNKFISIDECTIGFKGRVSFRVYNKDKPNKWGIKVYALADAENGYMYAMEPYFGAQTTNLLICPELPTTARIVVHLASTLPNSGMGYHIFIDRYYSSPLLAEKLSSLKINVTGTVMTNRRGLPEEVKATKKMNKGETLGFFKGNTMGVTIWKDKRPVTMLTNYYDFSTESVTRRAKVNNIWVEETISKPKVITEYNRFMGGIDLADHYMTTYCFDRKCRKWWRKIFFFALDASILNALILYRLSTGKMKFRSLDFRRELVENLVGSVRNNRTNNLTVMVADNRLNDRFHSIKVRKSNVTCKVCSKPKARKTTTYYCDTCNGKPAIHPGECFNRYHTQQVYTL